MKNTIYNQTSARLILRKLGDNDCSFILELVNTEGWLKFIGDRDVFNEKDALAYIEKILGDDNVTYLVVTLKDDTQIGIITLIKRENLDFHDIGFAFLPTYYNKGFALEASKTVLDYIIQSTDLGTLLATTIPENKSSIKLIEKLGMVFYKSNIEKDEELSLYRLDLDLLRLD